MMGKQEGFEENSSMDTAEVVSRQGTYVPASSIPPA
jgi:hypothetical protein